MKKIIRCGYNTNKYNYPIRHCGKIASWQVGFSEVIFDSITPFGEASGLNEYRQFFCDKHFIDMEGIGNTVEFREIGKEEWTSFDDYDNHFTLTELVRDKNLKVWLEQQNKLYNKDKVYDEKKKVWKTIYPVEKIGSKIDENIIIVQESFSKHLFEYIRPFQEDFDYSFRYPINGIDTRIICPLCIKGTILMIKKKSNYCSIHHAHTSNSYMFYCSDFSEDGCRCSLIYHEDLWQC